MDRKELADLIFPEAKEVSYYEEKYPERDLPEGAQVVRVAPSPTGFIHVGGIFQGLIAKKIAQQTGGVFFVRIEDTDQKRKIENGNEEILNAYKDYDLYPDETVGKGNYGPYVQSERKEIYQAYAKKLLEEGNAYPCFCSPEELSNIRENQTKAQERTGYYGKWAKCRNMPVDMAYEKIKNGDPYIIRLKSPGNPEKKIKIKDVIKGGVDMPENDQDIVIIKSDGLPTYHFAHAVDDHLMHTTLVTRSDEWLSSVPLHIQLFRILGFKVPKFAHTAPLEKTEDGARRKLSKRKDPEAAVSYYHEKGIPIEAVKLYLLTIANSNFEAWLDANPNASIYDFKFDFKKMSDSGSLFDVEKLLNISKNYISKLTAQEVYNNLEKYTEEYDKDFNKIITSNKEYTTNILNIEREQKKPRKDYASYSDIKNHIWYMFDELFNSNNANYEFQKINDKEEIKNILNEYVTNYYNEEDDKETWFNKIKQLCDKLNYASNMKDYKENPEQYKGNVADISTVIRVTLTTKCMTPDLYEIMKLLGKERIIKRITMLNVD